MADVIAFPEMAAPRSSIRDGHEVARVVLREVAAHPLNTITCALDVLETSARRSDRALCRAARIELAAKLAEPAANETVVVIAPTILDHVTFAVAAIAILGSAAILAFSVVRHWV